PAVSPPSGFGLPDPPRDRTRPDHNNFSSSHHHVECGPGSFTNTSVSSSSRGRLTVGEGRRPAVIVGVPKEVKDNEYRVALTPEGARELTRAGHRVLVQEGAGEGSSLYGDRYK